MIKKLLVILNQAIHAVLIIPKVKDPNYDSVTITFLKLLNETASFFMQTFACNEQFIIGIVKEKFSESCLITFFMINRISFHKFFLSSTITFSAKFKLNSF